MVKLILVLSFLLLFSTAHSQEVVLPLWADGRIPNAQPSEEIEKSDSSDIVRISKVQVPQIAVYLPSKRNATGQAVVICPGGGYSILAYDWEGTDVAKWLSSKGIAAIVLKYRLPNVKSNITPHVSPLMDAQRAIRLVRANAAKWNIKQEKIGIMGFSAGGHLASTAGTHFGAANANPSDTIEKFSCRPDFMMLIYPVISMTKPIMHSGSKRNLLGENADPKLAEYYSSELQVTKETPPTFLVHATDDKSVPVENSLLFYQALKNNGVPAELHVYPSGGHGFGLALNIPQTLSWTDRCIDWLKGLNN